MSAPAVRSAASRGVTGTTVPGRPPRAAAAAVTARSSPSEPAPASAAPGRCRTSIAIVTMTPGTAAATSGVRRIEDGRERRGTCPKWYANTGAVKTDAPSPAATGEAIQARPRWAGQWRRIQRLMTRMPAVPATVSWKPAPATTAGRRSASISIERPRAPRARAGVWRRRPRTNAVVIQAARVAEVGAPMTST
ncbi:MAG: hypothetical protein OXU64_11030 [Gemmatimonadota bacterium]|nr:hypothetical protein [Gemmatimonadota bacterium]